MGILLQSCPRFAGENPQTTSTLSDRLMRIETDLLGVVNEHAHTNSVLQKKYMLRVTAEQLAQWLQFDRKSKAKSSPFRISSHSIIRIDEDIQRGRDASGFLLQNPKKIMEIASTLLNPTAEQVPRLYLGSLIWNVRPVTGRDINDHFSIQRIEEGGKPTRWRLTFDTDAIYLTDSAHRHLGIVEAVRQYLSAPHKFPGFDPKTEFSVELYTLSKSKEKELFSELNAKQKKISAAKQKQMDVSSPIGALKDSIIDYDRAGERFFENNVEVSSNQNDKHTLLTMSVFQSSIGEMFSLKEIKESREDDELRLEMATFYCEFFYELARTIVVRADLGDGEKEHHPFRNLYRSYIQPVVDVADPTKPQLFEEQLQIAIERATKENRQLRRIDIVNHNAFVKALSRLGGYIRRMENWRDVITRLQTRLNIARSGKLFQRDNPDLFAVNPQLGVSIATSNEDGSINVQVQTKTINAIYDYLMSQLNLRRHFAAFHSTATEDPVLLSESSLTHHIPTDSPSYSAFDVWFYLPKAITEWGENSVRLDIDGKTAWAAVTRKGKNKGLVSSACEPDLSYVDDAFEDIGRWRATFEIQWPPGNSFAGDAVEVSLKFSFPRFEDPFEMASESRTIKVSKLSQ